MIVGALRRETTPALRATIVYKTAGVRLVRYADIKARRPVRSETTPALRATPPRRGTCLSRRSQ